jgi:hypothetical protein
MEKLTRRLFLRSAPSAVAASAIVGAPAVIASGEPLTSQLTAIPTDVYDKIAKWKEAHLRSVAAAKAYSDSLRVKPIDKGVCDVCFAEMIRSERDVGPARQDMIVALLAI